jgi:threonyl-tRNA synthetase
MLHVDAFRSTITERGRSSLVEEVNPSSKTTEVAEALLVLASVEKADLLPEKVSERAVAEIAQLARKLKVGTVVLHPFAHLFGDLSSPQVAVKTLKLTEDGLIKEKFKVVRTPFGWFNTLELRAKGHPLSRVARIVTADQSLGSQTQEVT